MKNIQAAYQAIKDEIASAEQRFGRPRHSVRLIAVSKTRQLQELQQLIDCGQQDFAENYLQEAAGKIAALADERLNWHFIGPVQANKTGPIARLFDWVHSVDREKIARRLSQARAPGQAALNICLQVNISGEASKSGADADKIASLAASISPLPGVRLRGLMALPAPTDDLARQRRAFARLRELYAELQAAGHAVDTLSMGTSHDLEAAIAEGATMVRIGTALFGPRD